MCSKSRGPETPAVSIYALNGEQKILLPGCNVEPDIIITLPYHVLLRAAINVAVDVVHV
jgi:hypothetical protein